MKLNFSSDIEEKENDLSQKRKTNERNIDFFFSYKREKSIYLNV